VIKKATVVGGFLEDVAMATPQGLMGAIKRAYNNHTRVDVPCQALSTKKILQRPQRPFVGIPRHLVPYLCSAPDALTVWVGMAAHAYNGVVDTPLKRIIEYVGMPRRRFYGGLKWLQAVGLVVRARDYLRATGQDPENARKRSWVLLSPTELQIQKRLESMAITESGNTQLWDSEPVQFLARNSAKKRLGIVPTSEQKVFQRRNKKCSNVGTKSVPTSEQFGRKKPAKSRVSERRYSTKTIQDIIQDSDRLRRFSKKG